MLTRWKLVGAVALFVAGIGLSWWWCGVLAASDKTESLERVIAQYEEQMIIDQEIYEEHLHAEHEIENRYQEIEQESGSVATPDCDRLGVDWLRLFNKATDAAAAATTPADG
ncbi:MAG: hypothetical protein ABW119_22095 [Candidatus Thiodiazotropha lotti]